MQEECTLGQLHYRDARADFNSVSLFLKNFPSHQGNLDRGNNEGTGKIVTRVSPFQKCPFRIHFNRDVIALARPAANDVCGNQCPAFLELRLI